MADRQEIAEAIATGLAQGELAGLSKADIYHRFQDRGASRATIYRAIDDAILLAAERGIPVEIEQANNQWAQPKASSQGMVKAAEGIPVTEMPPAPPPAAATERRARTEMPADEPMLDLQQIRAAIGDVGRAISNASMRSSATFSDGLADIRRTIATLRHTAGDGETADRIINGLVDALRQDPSAAMRLASAFGHGGHAIG
jgi:hypothetical protein